ncbi:MAG TPA: UDP-N-acetylmuramoyl-tripeptide--D-alanyl-D-alanine ligase [Candidatus Nanopelagicales bacterium]|nr:UDP-N-acetylmuramoyl-tripeptide--D-alanyl-D-alanine ligase [Candidatus Nanopelagicales bacterium]
MIPLTLEQVARATGGALGGGADPAAVVTGVSTDTRAVATGELFVAVVGERVDAHDLAADARAAGAAAVLASRPVDVPHVLVDGTVEALGRLAHAVLADHPAVVVVGVTGSSGKTSTKDLLAHLLPAYGPTVAPQGSLNTEVGLPVTVLGIAASTRVLVAEMGARGIGHIRYLCGIAPPRIGVVLNVGSAHVGEFGSRENIALAKGELVECLPAASEGGVAVLNADDPLVAAMAHRTRARVVTYGESAGATVRAADVELDDQGRASFALLVGGRRAGVRLGLHGRHHVSNALAAAAVATSLGVDLDEVAAALGQARPASRWRMEVSTAPSGATVVNDAYNANPDSVRAALQALAAMTRDGRRGTAVLGEMLELGETTVELHEETGREAARSGAARLVAVGASEPVAALVRGYAAESGRPDAAQAVPDADAALAALGALGPDDVVLVKASRAAGLERLALALTEVAS